ncbi:MAG TPA: DUF1592 domain-containing protein [Polyangiaceae bacterium]
MPKTSAALVALALVVVGCEAAIEPGSPGVSVSGGSTSVGGGAALPTGTPATALLPARIRRLTDAEYQASAAAIFGPNAPAVGADFVPDSRQSGFTVNEAQRVDPVLAGQLADAASRLAADLRQHVTERAPCPDPGAGAEACARSFIASFGQQVYRRPLADDETAQLLTLFRVAFEGGSYEEGIELVVRGMLQSASFLYLTELGEAPGATVKLTPYELASAMSYLIQGRPPTAELLGLALSGKLDTPEDRAAALPSLFGVDARARVVRVIREWLGTDGIAESAKDSNVYPDFEGVKAAMDRETSEFLQVVVESEGASLAKLLSADFTLANAPLAKLYGATAGSADVFERVATPTRLGILNQGAFLSVFAHAHETAPVLRGVAIARRVACIPLVDPVSLSIAIVPPVPDLTKTTRERFDIHSRDASCAGCHKLIDNFGFAFEGFDGMGKARQTDAGKPVNTSVVVSGTDFDGSYADSNALASAMSKSAQVRECFARHVFRALSGTSAPELVASEDDFVGYWKEGLTMDDANIIDTLSAYVTSPAFAYRRSP